jgi:hypothetical protein
MGDMVRRAVWFEGYLRAVRHKATSECDTRSLALYIRIIVEGAGTTSLSPTFGLLI